MNSDQQQPYPVRLTPLRLSAPLGIAFDQGRAAALQLLTHHENPYTRRLEPDEYDAWLAGFRSLNDE